MWGWWPWGRKVRQGALPIVGKMIVILWGEQNFHNLVSRTARRSKYQGNKEHPLPTLGQTPCALFLIPVTAITTGLEDFTPDPQIASKAKAESSVLLSQYLCHITLTVLNITCGLKEWKPQIDIFQVTGIYWVCFHFLHLLNEIIVKKILLELDILSSHLIGIGLNSVLLSKVLHHPLNLQFTTFCLSLHS